MNIARRLLLVLLISVFLFGCSGNKATTEGKLVDGKGQPIAGITVIFRQVQPTADSEQLEAKTGADGIFRLSGLISSSEYIITPVSDKWKTNVTMKITTGREGQIMVLTNPIVIRFNLLGNGIIIDTKTGLQWLIYTASDLKADNVLNIVKNIREGGFSDWRLPSKADILDLQEKLASPTAQSEAESARQTCCAWLAEPNSEKVEWEFYVDDGNELWSSNKMPPNDRVVVVRNYSASSTTTPVPIAAPTVVTTPSPTVVSPAPAVVTAPAVSEKKDAAGAAQTGNTVIVRFDPKKATINTKDLAALKVFYTKVKDASGGILIEGHSDAGGSTMNTMKNSVDLALSTLSLLKKMGLSDKAKVELKGMGDTKPVADNKTPEGRQQNRRVELTFIPE